MEAGARNYLNYSDIGIYINANGSFIIRNCKISSISIGIHFSIGVSAGPIHVIERVEINNAGLGFYCPWRNIAVNISRCQISNCNWVTIKAPNRFDTPIYYGGYGIWLRGNIGSNIEFCRIQNCSIGLVATSEVDLISNQLINCGLSFDYSHGFPTYRFNNTVNGKPIGLFYGEDNLIISGQEASQYGQLIFIACDNLQLSNIHIEDPCSIGLIIYYCDYPMLQNIVCENQKIGFFIVANYATADDLYAENCDAGFYLYRIEYSTFSRLSTDNTDIPVYTLSPIYNCTIGIEKSTRFYIIDYYFGYDTLQLNSSVSSFTVSLSFIPALDIECFLIQINDTQTYHVTDSDPGVLAIDFIIVSFQRSQPWTIPWFLSFWLVLTPLLGVVFLIIVYQYKKKIKVKSVTAYQISWY